MSSTSEPSSGRLEECGECERETFHAVGVEIRTENPDHENASYSREPYRVTECAVCGHSEAVRMNGGGPA